MNRREFVRLAGSGVAVGALAEVAEATVVEQRGHSAAVPGSTGQKVLFKVGTGGGGCVENLKFLASYGVNHITGGGGGSSVEGWAVPLLKERKELAANHGISIELASLPLALERHLDPTDGRHPAGGTQSRPADRRISAR